MARLTAADVRNMGVPTDLNDSLIVRCIDKKFAPNSKNNPMITCTWEIIGIADGQGGIAESIKRGDKEFVISGLRTRPTYHTITKKALFFFQEWWSKCTGRKKEELDIDTENPDLSFLDGLVMSVTCTAETQEARKKLTEEEKEALQAQGLEPKGEIIIDPETGEAKKYTQAVIQAWNNRYTGELPTF
jgi:hypothetical protein